MFYLSGLKKFKVETILIIVFLLLFPRFTLFMRFCYRVLDMREGTLVISWDFMVTCRSECDILIMKSHKI